MCLWDLVDGKCREVVKLPYVHTNVQVKFLFHDVDIYPHISFSFFFFELMILDSHNLLILRYSPTK